MRALNTEFELFDASRLLPVGSRAESGWLRKRPGEGNPEDRGKYKNSGNEAKKWLKTNDITFLMVQIRRVSGADSQ